MTELEHRAFEWLSLSASGGVPGQLWAQRERGERCPGALEQTFWKGAVLGAVQDDRWWSSRCGRGDCWLSGPGQLCAQGTGVADLLQAGLGSEAPGRGAAAV